MHLLHTTGQTTEQESCIYRSSKITDLVTTAGENIDTVYGLVQKSIQDHRDVKTCGHRDVIATISEEKEIETVVNGVPQKVKKTWNYYQLADYDWWTYAQLGEILDNVGSGLIETGLQTGDKLGIFAPTK
jgi:long-chain acyl-CoA synthetase